MSHAKALKPGIVPRTPHVRHTKRKHDVRHSVISKEVAKSALKTTVGGVLMAVAVSLLLQLAYPRSMALPQTRIGGQNYGFASKGKITAGIAALEDQQLTIKSGSQTFNYTPKELGLTLSGKADAEQATRYSWKERFIPFSFFFERREVPYYSFTVDETKAKNFAVGLQKHNKAPVDAAVRLEGTSAVVVKQQDGYAYETDYMVEAIKDLKLTSNKNIALQPKVVQPVITDLAASEAATVLEQRLQQPITVSVEGKTATAEPALLATWTVLTPDLENKKLQVSYDKEKIKQWLAPLADQVYRPGKPRAVTMIDGEVTSTADPSDGIALNKDATADAVIAAATAKQAQAKGVTSPVTVAAQVIRNYTRSSKGLQALLNYWDESNSGSWGIVLKETGGSISASLNPDRQFTSASVYKIFVAYVVYSKADNGEISMDSSTNIGNTVSGCLDIMIVRSDNPCGHALGDMIGWGSSNGKLQAKGFGSTSLSYGGQTTTARDAAEFMMQLQNGTLLSGASRDALMYKLGHNIYRYAIPAGSMGYSINKLGALGAYNHDVAVVYHPKGTYVLSVFSNGSSHARIRELARQISNLMNQ